MSRFDRNKVSYDLSNNAYNKQIKVVNRGFKSEGVVSVNGQDGEVVLNYIDQLEKGIPEGVAPLNSEGIVDEQYLPPISEDSFKTINGESVLGSGNIVTPNDNTTYTAGAGLSLSGTTFSQDITTNGTGSFVTGITQTTNGLQVNLGTPPNTIPNDGTLTLDTGTGLSGGATFSADQSTNSTFTVGIASGYVLPTTAQTTSWNNKQDTITGGATTIASANLTANRALISNASGKVAVSPATSTELSYLSGVTSAIQTQLNDKINTSLIGANNGVARLDSNGLVLTTQLPSYVDDVIEASNLAALNALPSSEKQSGKIYVALDTNKTYRWSGSAFIYITSGAVDSVAGKTGVVTLVKGDVGLDNVDNTADSSKSVLSASKLTTARTINGTSFNGSANIITANWGTARNIGIGNTTKSVDGSANITWSLAEIGAVSINTVQTITGKKSFQGGAQVLVAPASPGDIVNKQYADSLVVLEPLDEGNGIGYRVKGRQPSYYGDIGNGAVDFSSNTSTSTTRGATGNYSVATGSGVTASGYCSVAMGVTTEATGNYSVAMGGGSMATGQYSIAIGRTTTASATNSTAFGAQTTASGTYSFAAGNNSTASSPNSVSMGSNNTASGHNSFAVGETNLASGSTSAVMGLSNTSNEYASLTIGRFSTGGTAQTSWVNGSPIFKVGNGTSTSNLRNAYVLNNDGTSAQYGIASYGADYSANFTDRSLVDKAYVDSRTPFNTIDITTPTVYTNKAINVAPFNNTGVTYSEGSIDFGITRNSTHKMGFYAFKQGNETTASGNYSSAFGDRTEASGSFSSAFGSSTIASGLYASSFGSQTTASGTASSAFGDRTKASGNYSATFGNRTEASGTYSLVIGYQSIANEFASLAIGRYSTDGTAQTSWVNGSPIFKVGNGSSTSTRRNAYVLYNDGRSEQIKDMEVTTVGQGFVLKSPNGTRWRITVDNGGNLITTSL